jgi:hypothetical protein
MTNMKIVGQRNLNLLGDKLFLVKVPVTLTFDLKINTDHLLIMTNLNTKYEDCGSKESIGRTRKSDGRTYGWKWNKGPFFCYFLLFNRGPLTLLLWNELYCSLLSCLQLDGPLSLFGRASGLAGWTSWFQHTPLTTSLRGGIKKPKLRR